MICSIVMSPTMERSERGDLEEVAAALLQYGQEGLEAGEQHGGRGLDVAEGHADAGARHRVAQER
ncbi:hypothetical protein, partial [Isoptericola sp. NPDC060257]|uniref:hypothetical protein n=1 Tax=Isoptericola sp. NPDC060257 TaxID=3347087 RepID=UPI003650DF73